MAKKLKLNNLIKIIKDTIEDKVEIYKDFQEFYKYGTIQDLDKEFGDKKSFISRKEVKKYD
jgi:hypothetical protein